MQGTIQKYTLDMADGTALKPLIVKQGDTNSRFARISLVAFKEPWTIPFGCQIHINVHKNDGTYANATCTQEDEHTVLAPITEQMTAVPGTQLGELFFLGVDGDIRSQTFPLVVWDAVSDLDRMVSSDDFQALKEALRDVKVSTEVADIAAQYATEQGNQARDGAQRANDAADSIQVAVDAAAAAKECESNAKDSETAAAQTQQAVTDYVEAQKAAFVGYSKRESDSKYANALTETATGEGSITVEDAWTAPVLGLEVAGKSEQVVTTGAQLLDFEQCLKEWNSKYTCSDGRVYTVNALGAGFQNPISFSYEDIKVTLSGKVRDISGSRYRIELMDSSGNSVGRIDKDTKSITVMASKIRLNFTEGGAGEYADIMINAGDTALPYEPYTGGAPSPSPDYPQDIISTGTVSTGAQLFDANKGEWSINKDVAIEQTGKDTVKIITNKDGGYKYAVFKVGKKETFVGKTVTLSVGNIVKSNTLSEEGIKLYWVKEDNAAITACGTTIKSNEKLTITLTDPQDDSTDLAVLLYSNTTGASVAGDYVIYYNIMLNAGDTALPWEPYTGGKPSPSVEYPQTLEVGVTGAQLFDASTIQAITKNGVTFTNNGDGSITVRGTATAQTSTNFVEVNLEPGQYRISGGNAEIKIIARVQDGETINYYSNNKFDVTISSNINIYMQIDSGKTVNSTVWPMLNAGDQPLPWEPYKGHQTANITLTEPLRGIVDYRDRIMCRDGVWGVERNTGEWIFDGSADEVWRKYELRQNVYYIDVQNTVHTGTSIVMADKLIGKVSGTGGSYKDLNVVWLQSTPDYPRLYINYLADNLEELRSKLQASPITVIYQLAKPIWDPFPTATQQALNELTTYAGTTHLTITAGGPAPTVTLDYVQDTHKALEQCQEAAKEYTDTQIAAIVAALPTATQAAIVDNQTIRLLQEV